LPAPPLRRSGSGSTNVPGTRSTYRASDLLQLSFQEVKYNPTLSTPSRPPYVSPTAHVELVGTSVALWRCGTLVLESLCSVACGLFVVFSLQRVMPPCHCNKLRQRNEVADSGVGDKQRGISDRDATETSVNLLSCVRCPCNTFPLLHTSHGPQQKKTPPRPFCLGINSTTHTECPRKDCGVRPQARHNATE
jgi:hypothetical protein